MQTIYYYVATAADVARLAPLFHAYRQLSVSLSYPGSVAESADWLTARISNGSGVFIVAERTNASMEKELLGFVTLYSGFSSVSLQHYWVLNDLYVTDRARGLGLGKALMLQAHDYATQTGAKGIELETSVDNHIAQALYEKLGYSEEKQYKHYFKKLDSSIS